MNAPDQLLNSLQRSVVRVGILTYHNDVERRVQEDCKEPRENKYRNQQSQCSHGASQACAVTWILPAAPWQGFNLLPIAQRLMCTWSVIPT